jgi:PDDEXK-like domain of unknown function (DUF3799)
MTGIHDMPFEKYQGIPAANKHLLDALAISPLHCWAWCINPERQPSKDTPAKVLGSAIHTSILEPERYEKEYVREPDLEECRKVDKAFGSKLRILNTLDDYKEACKQLDLPVSGTKAKLKNQLLGAGYLPNEFWDELYPTLVQGRKVLSEADWRVTQAITNRIRKHIGASVLFEDGKAEQSLFWTDPDTGVDCKGRVDWITTNNNEYDTIPILVDLKSTLDASPEGFQRSISKYRYYVQAAMYIDGLTALGYEPETFIFAAWEKRSPYASALYYATPEMLALGRQEYKRLLKVYAECLSKDKWLGYSQAILPINLPDSFKPSSLSELEEDWLETMGAE